MRNHAIRRGYELKSLSRQFIAADFKKFDYIVVMDDSNYSNVMSLDHADLYSNKVYKMVDFCTKMKLKEVPDPYYGGEQGFETVLDIVEDAGHGFLEFVKKEL